MRLLDLIAKKRDGAEHSAEELRFLAGAAAAGSAPDYQLSAWLMAVVWRGMTARETAALTEAMARSGALLSYPGVRRPLVDKHSTGGVGDGVSLALAPLVAAAGAAVPMMSGRGLGHTGGTLDKLESIRGLKVRLSAARVKAQMKALSVVLFGQSGDLSPADRKLYALRDATGTVGSRPLIVGSILSKKMAEGLDGLVLDIKSGNGAIFKTPAEARDLGRDLVATAKRLKLSCVAVLTRMDEPLGKAVGNALEMRQAIEILHGRADLEDYHEVLLTLGGWMLKLGKTARTPGEGMEMIQARIDDGSGLALLRKVVRAQGGDTRVVDEPDRLKAAPRVKLVKSPADGRVLAIHARTTGEAGVLLGAGRATMDDALDYGAGIVLEKKVGDAVRQGEVLARVYASDAARLAAGTRMFAGGVRVGRGRPARTSAIRDVLR